MNRVAHNLSVAALIAALQDIGCEYVDVMVEGELTLAFRKSVYQGEDEYDNEEDEDDEDDEEENETDITKTII